MSIVERTKASSSCASPRQHSAKSSILTLLDPFASPEALALRTVASRFPEPDHVQFRNVRRIATDPNKKAEFCGQANATDGAGAWVEYQLFM